MTRTIITALALALITSTSALAAGGCNRTITVNGKPVQVVEGLKPGECLKRTIMLKGRDCPTGKALAEPMTEEALKKYPVGPGEEAGFHFRCIRNAS